MSTGQCDVLIFVEDPGAANFLAPLPAALTKLGVSSTLLAMGLSVHHLRARSAEFVDLTSSNQEAAQLIARYAPSVIVAGTAENKQTLAFDLFRQARTARIPTVGVVDMVVNADCRFRGEGESAFANAPEYIMVPDDDTRRAFASLGFAPDRLVVTGYPQFDFVREKLQEAPEQSDVSTSEYPAEIVFVAEPESKLNPALSTRNANYGFKGRGQSDFRTHIILEELIAALQKTQLPARLIVRLHPKNSLEQFTDYRTDVAEFSHGGDPLAAFQAADLVVGITSMALQEAAWLGKRTLAVLPESTDKEKLAAISSGLTPAVFSPGELRDALEKFKCNDWPQPQPEKFFKSGAAGTMASFIDRLRRMKPKELSPCS
ncbi:MAG: hypothetical protein U0105_15390 [Candidatus Obscuribacterales bacterium]